MDLALSFYVPLPLHDRSAGPGCAVVGLGSLEGLPSRVKGLGGRVPVLDWRRGPPPPASCSAISKQQCVCSVRATKYRPGELRPGDNRVKSGNGVEGVEPTSTQFRPKSQTQPPPLTVRRTLSLRPW